MSKPTDVRLTGCALHLLPVQTRVPLKFGAETLTSVTCARVRATVRGADGRQAVGWGETPLSVQWVWPGALPYAHRHDQLIGFCRRLAPLWAGFTGSGHALEIGHDLIHGPLTDLWKATNAARAAAGQPPMPWLAALVCASAFDLAVHDAYGVLHGVDTYATYGRDWLSRDLAAFIEPAAGAPVDFAGRFPADFLVAAPPARLPAWHLVGGLDAIDPGELPADAPRDGHPVLLGDWIARDGLRCLKIKLRGNDAAWDWRRLLAVGRVAAERGVTWLSADFNCTVTDPAYVTGLLDRLLADEPAIWQRILYVEQPFPYDLEEHPIDAHAVSARKPLFMDESAHDWTLLRLGRGLGWTGVALKTCKTQTGALLALCWAKAHGMTLMVQDLTNPMLAQIPHCRLAAHAGTIMGVETNGMQFYPAASAPEAAVHPGLYQRRDGCVDLSTLGGPGFGYRLERIARTLPAPLASAGG